MVSALGLQSSGPGSGIWAGQDEGVDVHSGTEGGTIGLAGSSVSMALSSTSSVACLC